MKNRVFKLILILFFILLTLNEILFLTKESKPFLFPQNKLWAHKGGIPHNSLEGIKKLLKQNVPGIEIDTFFDQKLKKFIITHDYNGKFNKHLTLEEIFNGVSTSKKVFFWLDFKNLSSSNIDDSSFRLKTLLNKYKFLDRTIIESQEGRLLGQLSKQGFNCSYWINSFSKSRFFWLRNIYNRFLILTSDFVSLSLPKESLNQKVRSSYKNFPLLIFTVNSKRRIRELKNDPLIPIILTDNYNL